jgi:type IV secretory pathway VirJ component
VPCAAAPRTVTIDNETLGPIQVLAPKSEPDRFVVLISDADGMTPRRLEEADALVQRGAAVALLDLVKLKATYAKAVHEDCFYTFGDLEDVARIAQRQLGVTDWHWPIMLGWGEGGTLAYLALAQAPANTAGGAVSIGFSASFPTLKPLCPGAPKASEANGAITYRPMNDVPGPWVLVTEAGPMDATQRAFLDAATDSKLETVAHDADEAARFNLAMTALFALSAPVAKGLSDLPLTELPGRGASPSDTVVILLSGDGGWRDIDKQIGEYIATRGIPVVGLDSLRYFWSRKEPGQIATDIERIGTFYLDKWKAKSVALIGYSFGADVIPAAWPNLSRELQEQTVLIALMGLEPTVDFEVSVSGWLGMEAAHAIDVRPYLAELPKDKVLCFFGTDEIADKSTACQVPELDGATRVERPGGHHFDGNYQIIADKILERLKAQ